MAHIGARGQRIVCGVGSLFHVGSGHQTQVMRLSSKHLYLCPLIIKPIWPAPSLSSLPSDLSSLFHHCILSTCINLLYQNFHTFSLLKLCGRYLLYFDHSGNNTPTFANCLLNNCLSG